MPETASTGEPEIESIAHVGIKPAEFSEPNANGWFTIMEAQFRLAKVSQSSTKFYHCLAALPPSVVNRLSEETVTGEEYAELKKVVLGLVETSRPEMFESLLSSEVLTGRPSACMSAMQRTASKVGVGEEFVRHKFLNSLPPNITPVLAAQQSLSLSQLGTLADELVAFAKTNSSSVCQASLSSQPRQREQRPQNMSVMPYRSGQRPQICRAHIYFADEARTCRPWCKWPNKRQCKIQAYSRNSSPAPSENRQCRFDPNDEGTL